MIVDDSACIRRHVAQILFGGGFAVHEAANGGWPCRSWQRPSTSAELGLLVATVDRLFGVPRESSPLTPG